MINFIREWYPFISVLLAMGAGSAITAESTSSSVRANTYNGYHCTPITTHTSLDSAMEQVHKHQEKTGVLVYQARG